MRVCVFVFIVLQFSGKIFGPYQKLLNCFNIMKILAAGRGSLPEYLNPILYGLANLANDILQTMLLLGQHAITDNTYELNLNVI